MQNNPWTDLPIAPAGRLSRRRVNSASQYELLWFRDERSHPGLLIEVDESAAPSQLRNFGINMRNVLIEITDLPDVRLRALLIRLTDEDKLDIFHRLCLDIAERVMHVDEKKSLLGTVCGRLKQWQSLFAGKTGGLLSSHEVQGLFAELSFLSELLKESTISEDVAVRGWKGPHRAQQDFILGDVTVEIKSLTGQNRGKVRISSEDQLYTHLSRLYLRVYFMAETSDGESLNLLVPRISGCISHTDLRALYEETLAVAGYIDLPEYDWPRFIIKERHTYLVTDHFPCITRKTLPVGIEAVSYDLLLATIESFRVTDEIVTKP